MLRSKSEQVPDPLPSGAAVLREIARTIGSDDLVRPRARRLAAHGDAAGLPAHAQFFNANVVIFCHQALHHGLGFGMHRSHKNAGEDDEDKAH